MTVDPRRIAIAFSAGCAFLHLYSPQSVLPFMAQELSIGAADASHVVTAGTLAVALTAPFTGAVSDTIGRKRMIVAAMVLLLIPTVMVALSQSLTELIVWRFVQGLLLPPVFVVTVAYIGDEWPAKEATAVFGLYASASALGGFFSRLVPGVLTDWVGWRGGFLALAVLNVVCIVAVVRLLPAERNFVRARSFAASAKQMLGHLRNPRLLATYAVGFGVLFNFIATFTFISFHLAAPPFNRSAFFLGAIFVVYLVGSAVALWTGRFIAALGRRRFVLIVLALWAAGMLLTLLPSLPAIVLGLGIAATCGILTQASSTGFVAITAKGGGTSSAVGLYVMSFYFGGTFGSWLAGLAYDGHGWPGSLLLILGMTATMAAVVVLFWREPPPAQPSAS